MNNNIEFDTRLEQILTAQSAGLLPGEDGGIDDAIAWHDFSFYELLREPDYLIYPSSDDPLPPYGGSRPSDDVVVIVCDTMGDPCPGGPFGLCPMDEMLNQIDGYDIDVVELTSFLASISGAIKYAITKQFGRFPEGEVPDEIHRIRAAYESGFIQGGYLPDLFRSFTALKSYERRNHLFATAMAGLGRLHGMDQIVQLGWERGDGLSKCGLFDVAIMANRMMSAASWLLPPVLPGSAVARSYLPEDLPTEYPFQIFEPSTYNAGLQLVYRQDWRGLGTQRGEIVRTVPLAPKQIQRISTKLARRNRAERTAESLRAVESTTEVTDTTKDSSEIVNEASKTFGMKAEASGSLGFGGLGISASGGISEEESQRVANTNTFLLETMQKTANKVRMESKILVSTEGETNFEQTSSSELMNPNDEIAVTYVYSKMQRQYEIYTRLNEVNATIFVAEEVPLPQQLVAWIREHDWIIAKALLDDSFRDALSAIGQDEPQVTYDTTEIDMAMKAVTSPDGILSQFATNSESISLDSADLTQEAQRAYREVQKDNMERTRSADLHYKKIQRLVHHVFDNILYYCRAVWSQEDPDQRLLRYEKLGIEVPVLWEYVGGTVTIGDVEVLDGEYVPDVSTLVPVTEIINPAGPIGYYGNYAVFYVKPDLRVLAVQDQAALDSSLFNVLDILLSFYIDENDPSQFKDPAYRVIELAEQQQSTFPVPLPDSTKVEMIEIVPDLRDFYDSLPSEDDLTEQEMNAVPLPPTRESFFADEQNFVPFWVAYLFRRRFSRTLVVDTNNLILDIEEGQGSTLEDFKRLHRYVDVRKAVAEETKLLKENDRLQARLDADRLSDPDIENVTIIKGQLPSITIVNEDKHHHGHDDGHGKDD